MQGDAVFRNRPIVFWSFPFLIFLSGSDAKPECDSVEIRNAVLQTVSGDHNNALVEYAAKNSTIAKSIDVIPEAEKSKQRSGSGAALYRSRALSISCAGPPALSGSMLFPALIACAIPSPSAMFSKGPPEDGPRLDFAEAAPADACHVDRWPVRRSRLDLRGQIRWLPHGRKDRKRQGHALQPQRPGHQS